MRSRADKCILLALMLSILVVPFTGAVIMGNEPPAPAKPLSGKTVEFDGVTYTLAP